MNKTEKKFAAKWPNGRFVFQFASDGSRLDPPERALHCVLEPCRGVVIPLSVSVCNYNFILAVREENSPGVFPFCFSTASSFISRPYETLDKLLAAARRKNTSEDLIKEFVKRYNEKKPYFFNAYSRTMNERM